MILRLFHRKEHLLEKFNNEMHYHKTACSRLIFKKNTEYGYNVFSESGECLEKYMVYTNKLNQQVKGYSLTKVYIYGFIPHGDDFIEMVQRFYPHPPCIDIR